MMSALTFGVLSFSSLLTIIDPIAAAPLFVALTDGADAERRRKTALKACAVSLGLLVVFAVAGGLIFRLFGITIDAFRIAGGILFFAMAMPMLTGAERQSPDGSDGSVRVDPRGSLSDRGHSRRHRRHCGLPYHLAGPGTFHRKERNPRRHSGHGPDHVRHRNPVHHQWTKADRDRHSFDRSVISENSDSGGARSPAGIRL